MKVRINNNEVETQATTVAELAQEQKLPEKGVAVAISNEMVPRTEWAQRALKEGDDIVILKAFCGG
ncbi:MAG: sulfur carrier protein ThiS [Prevotella sp.]|uniref:sulfur carrier protein ThiS n=1 Tax=Prevotella sp. P5-92 TaxID=2024222 RepID=UPI000B9674B0|nr:sulfur carrier protein ThiS [Prevotella sp. P5-92]MCI7399406.1 sulfur carrier protein ThiS [Prevotella sp.]MDD6820702.1 sulfur carrier protein ThiS [Prevotella sp.]MDY4653347.1 sulfur carrier protein ThiS [Prevotella sp.]OYP59788.1 thiamine biosynthesis protein ThiS [Prevotella sp. P5-92]